MSEIFNKSDFKNGMSFKIRYGEKCYIVNNEVYRKIDEFILESDSSLENWLDGYDENLLGLFESPHGADIMEVYDTEDNLVWKREEIDWTKVLIDTKVLVREDENADWLPSHFAGYSNGYYCTYPEGRTSWTNEKGNVLRWNQCKLAEKSKNGKYGFSFPILDTSEIAFEEELDKLKEETEELLGDSIKYKTNEIVTIDNVIEESYDVIQVVVNIIDRLGLIDYMPEGLEKHIEKLKGRGWKFKEVSKK